MPDQPMEERIAAVLREHRYKVEQAVCSCSDFVQVGLRCDDQTHEQHVAAVVAGIVREAKAEAFDAGKQAIWSYMNENAMGRYAQVEANPYRKDAQ